MWLKRSVTSKSKFGVWPNGPIFMWRFSWPVGQNVPWWPSGKVTKYRVYIARPANLQIFRVFPPFCYLDSPIPQGSGNINGKLYGGSSLSRHCRLAEIRLCWAESPLCRAAAVHPGSPGRKQGENEVERKDYT
jgi:hypothetical protein